MTTQTSRRKFIQAGIMTSIGSFAGVAPAAGDPARPQAEQERVFCVCGQPAPCSLCPAGHAAPGG